MIDAGGADAFVNGLGLGIFSLTACWGLLMIVHFFKSLLNGVMP